jgi:putative transposase
MLWVPHSARVSRGAQARMQAASSIILRVFQPLRNPLRRFYGQGDLHFITTSCYRRKPMLGSARARDIFLEVLEQIRGGYRFDVVGYVVMPEHVHLLLGEPEKGNPSVVMQALKQGVAQRLLRKPKKRDSSQIELWKAPIQVRSFWQRRFYDFNVFSEAKRVEKLKYMHANPVKRGLVSAPEFWRWSSYRIYAFAERGPVNMDWMFPPYTMKRTRVRRFGQPEENDLLMIQHTHPAKSARSAAPTARSRRQKSKP